MKVIVSESKRGIEYLADVISSCNQNGIECIVDDNAGEILYYLPKEGRYGDDKLLQNSDESIFDLVRNKERLVSVLRDAKGDEFKKFAVKWNGLQTKGEDEEVYKTDHCNPIRGNFSEGLDNPKHGKYTAKIEWAKDFPKYGISAGDSDEVRVRFSEVDALAHAHGRNGIDELIEKKMNEKYPGIGQLDCEYDYIITNEEDMYDYHDRFMGKEGVYENFDD